MFSGKEQVITVRIPDTLVGPFIDQFGKRITISEYTEGMLLVTFNAVASVILLGWLLGLQYVIIRLLACTFATIFPPRMATSVFTTASPNPVLPLLETQAL